MTLLDIIILIITIIGGFYGYKSGLISQFSFPITFIILIYKGYYIFIRYKNLLHNYINNKIYLLTCSTIISIISVIFFVHILNKSIKLIITMTWMKPIDQLGGMMFGLIKYFLYISTFLFFIKKFNQITKFTYDGFFHSVIEKKLELLLYKRESIFKSLFDQINTLLKF
ncbi:CvpA family protein [Blattabacterium cuenoti]|uniref:CvpA family protein n=1 Tax=Blattabacterium cuenoti TaxID=1653831 RepID=UPI00163C2A7F|nr:CvpA family protein [Blattabacterium cuenoti]